MQVSGRFRVFDDLKRDYLIEKFLGNLRNDLSDRWLEEAVIRVGVVRSDVAKEL